MLKRVSGVNGPSGPAARLATSPSRRLSARWHSPPRPSSSYAAPTEAHFLGELGAGLGVVRRHHWVVSRQAPPLAVLLGRHVVLSAQVAPIGPSPPLPSSGLPNAARYK